MWFGEHISSIIFDLQKLKSETKISQTKLLELQYADDQGWQKPGFFCEKNRPSEFF